MRKFYRATQALKEWAKRLWDKHLKKDRSFLSGIILGVFLGLLPATISFFLFRVGKSDAPLFFILYIGIVVLFATILLILGNKEFRNLVEKKSVVVNILLVLFTLAITLSAFYVDRLHAKNLVENSLININTLNYQYADEISQDVENQWLYWKYLSIKPYEDNFGYIVTNYGGECVGHFANVIRSAEVINEMNRIINENSAWGIVIDDTNQLVKQNILFVKNKKELLKRANDFKESMNNLAQSCYGYSPEEFSGN